MKIFLSLILLCSVPSLAGQSAGNGGGILICKDKTSQYHNQQYDLYELKYQKNPLHKLVKKLSFDPSIKLSSSDPSNAFKIVDRLKRLNPTRAKKYSRLLTSLNGNSEITDDELTKHTDLGTGLVPDGCEFKNIAEQYYFSNLKKSFFRFNTKITELKAIDVVSMYLHEVVLFEATMENEHKNSLAARFLNGFLFSNEILSMSLNEYHEMLVSLEFKYADTHAGVPFLLQHPNNRINLETGLFSKAFCESSDKAVMDMCVMSLKVGEVTFKLKVTESHYAKTGKLQSLYAYQIKANGTKNRVVVWFNKLGKPRNIQFLD
jgi:hypothetical protein